MKLSFRTLLFLSALAFILPQLKAQTMMRVVPHGSDLTTLIPKRQDDLRSLNLRSRFFTGWTAIPFATDSKNEHAWFGPSYRLTAIPLPDDAFDSISTDLNVLGEAVGVVESNRDGSIVQDVFVFRNGRIIDLGLGIATPPKINLEGSILFNTALHKRNGRVIQLPATGCGVWDYI